MHAPKPAAPTLPRSCGSCAMCCYLGEIEGFKPYNQWCSACSTQTRCDRYDTRPTPCRQFQCLYTMSDLPEAWYPPVSHMVVSRHSTPARMTVLVDPETPLIWREGAYLSQLQAWAVEAPVTVMVGLAAFAVYPNRIEALGEITPEYSIAIHEQQLASGERRYQLERVRKPS